jgi:hypothetical protein
MTGVWMSALIQWFLINNLNRKVFFSLVSFSFFLFFFFFFFFFVFLFFVCSPGGWLWVGFFFF